MSEPPAVLTGAVPTRGIGVDYCGEWYALAPGGELLVGREGDLQVDDNPFLHRRFLRISDADGLWWVENVGSRISATVTEADGGVTSWLSPGARLPVVFPRTTVTFVAGPTAYEFELFLDDAPYRSAIGVPEGFGDTTVGSVTWTPSQLRLMIALAEPLLRRPGTGLSEIPSSAQAARRLGWTLTRFNRKLDNVCDKLDRIGVTGLRGGRAGLATNRRVRLVEYVIASHLITAEHLPLLEIPDPA